MLRCSSRALPPLLAVLAALAFVLPLGGCKKRQAAAPVAGNPRVRVVHAIPDGLPVDIFASDIKIVSGLAYKADTGYVQAVPGTFNVRVTPSGGTGTAFGPAPVTLVTGTDYTVVAGGTVAGKNVQPLILTDDKRAARVGFARMRVVHAAPDAPAVDLLLNDRLAIANLGFGKATDVYMELAAGTYQAKVAATGTTAPVLGPLPLRLDAGKTYTLLALGNVGDKTLNVQVLTDQ